MPGPTDPANFSLPQQVGSCSEIAQAGHAVLPTLVPQVDLPAVDVDVRKGGGGRGTFVKSLLLIRDYCKVGGGETK